MDSSRFLVDVTRRGPRAGGAGGAWDLVVFPPSGRGAAPYYGLDTGGRDATVTAVRLPGRELLLRSVPLTRVDQAVERVLPAVAEMVRRRPTVLLGHSLGGTIAAEVAGALERMGLSPAALVIAASAFPRPERTRGTSDLSDEGLTAWLSDMDGTPDEILENPDFLAMILPVLRADLRMSASHPAPGFTGLDCPLVVLGGDRDPAVDVEDLRRWSDMARGPVLVDELPGGHFFPDHSVPAILDRVERIAGELPRNARRL